METTKEIATKPAKTLPDCPVETTLTLISDKWKVLILRDLLPGTKRFGELKKSIGHVSQKVLTAQLRQMEEYQARYDIFMEYAPQMMSAEEVEQFITEKFAEVVAGKNKGVIMKNVMPELKGKADGSVINQVVAKLCQS